MASSDALDSMFVADLVGHLYEAAVNPELWTDFVEIFARLYPDSRVTLFGHQNGRPSDALAIRKNFPADAMRDYVDYFVGNSPYVARVPMMQIGVAIKSESVITDGELVKTEHYNDFVRPHRLGHYATGILLERAPGIMTAFSLADHTDDEARRAHQMRLLDAIAPHFRRAIRLRRALIEQNAAANASQAAFDRWTHAGFVLGATGRVLVMNAAARSLVKQDAGLWLTREGRLRSFDEGRTQALDAAIARCAAISSSIGTLDGEPELAGVLLPRPAGATLHAMIWPLQMMCEEAEFGDARGRVLIMIFDPDSTPRAPIGWLARQFKLSPSEARLADAIVNGVPLVDAAERLGIRLSTARTRLKAIQAKTGCHRQVDLVRLAMSMPAVRRE